jgi:hypothetical protein
MTPTRLLRSASSPVQRIPSVAYLCQLFQPSLWSVEAKRRVS